MDSRNDQDIPFVAEQASDASLTSEESTDDAPPNFDEDAYLLAFPDVAKAVSEGVCRSPLQHYMEYGRHENRLALDSYLHIISGRQLEGYIDFYGHNEIAGGWIFCGWSSERWEATGGVTVVVHFQNGVISGESISAFYHRTNLKGRGTGVVLFVRGADENLGPLGYLDVSLDAANPIISATPTASRKDDQEILFAARALLAEHQEAANHSEILTLLSTKGYGRLRQTLNVLSGFVDSYGYHAASGGWFFCGWTTRSWDDEVGPDELIAHFVDGDVKSSETIAGFYPRDDLNGRGIGCVMFVYGAGRPLGSLVSVELRVGGIASFIRAPSSSHRFRDVEIATRLRPILGQVFEPEAGATLLALLARRDYSGVDTIGSLSGPIFLEFDEVIACPPGGLALMGWFLAKSGSVRGIRIRSDLLNEPLNLEDCIKIDRPDVISSVGAERGFDDPRCGFITYLPSMPASRSEIYAEVETAGREVGFRKLPTPRLEGIQAIKRLLSAFDVRYDAVPRVFDTVIGPAVQLLNDRRLTKKPRVHAIEFGKVAAAPRFSIIVPLHGRLDYLEPQMAFFAIHPQSYDYEFIFVLDDPPKQREAERLFSSSFARFQIPFRVLILEQNVGFAPANNVGCRLPMAPIFASSTPMSSPAPPTGLRDWRCGSRRNSELGAVGPLLLYGDGSVRRGYGFPEPAGIRQLAVWRPCSQGHEEGSGIRPAPAISITGASNW